MILLLTTISLIKKTDSKTKITFCLKYLYYSLNNDEELTWWAFAPLGPTFTYKTSNLNNLSSFLESNQCIDCDRCNHKNWHPLQNLTKAYGGSKYVCPVWILPTDDLLSYPRKSFRINVRWPTKYNTHK